MEQVVSPYLPHESTRSRGNVVGPEGDAVGKIQVVVEGTLGEGGRGRRRCNRGIGLSRGASFTLGAARRATPTHCSASCTYYAKLSTGEGGAVEVYPLEASTTLKGFSAHIKVIDGAGVPGARIVADDARFG